MDGGRSVKVYAYIRDDLVIRLAICESASVANLQVVALGFSRAEDVTEIDPRPLPGWTWPVGQAPVPGELPAPPKPRLITTTDLINRFSSDEWEILATHTSAKARAFVARLQACSNVWLDDPKLAIALGAMVSAGILSADRPAQITA